MVLIFQDMFRIGIATSTEPIWSSYISINEDTSVKDYLYPGTYLNVIILHNRESFHFVLSSQKIGKIYIYSVSKRFMVHNLSDVHLCVIPFLSSNGMKAKVRLLLLVLIICHKIWQIFLNTILFEADPNFFSCAIIDQYFVILLTPIINQKKLLVHQSMFPLYRLIFILV